MFSIVFVLLGLIMLPKKEVKAQQQEFAPILIKTTWVYTYYDVENTNTYEFVVTYKIDGIFINNLNRFEYFFVTKRYFSMYHDRFDRSGNSYVIEEIQIKDNSTVFYVRITLSSARINQYYGGVEYVDELFSNDSAFYVYVMYEDVAGQAYNAGYENGFEDGYNSGYENGFENGKEAGYDEGYIIGRDDGYNNGYNVGYNDGLEVSYDLGYNDGYEDGKEYGINFGREHWYDVGYQAGYNAGINEQLADKDFSNLLRSVFIAIGTFLGINLLPGISIGAIIAVPIVFGIIAFILGRKKD